MSEYRNVSPSGRADRFLAGFALTGAVLIALSALVTGRQPDGSTVIGFMVILMVWGSLRANNRKANADDAS